MRKNVAKHLKTAAASIALLAMALPAAAVSSEDLGFGYAEGLGLPMNIDIRGVVANLIRTALGFLGLLLVIQIMWAGFLMMTHGGDEEKRAAAIATLKNSIIGLFIIVSSVSIVRFVVNALGDAAGTYL